MIDTKGRDEFAPSHEGEFTSGEVVPPGVYVDVESGARITVRQAEELPEGVRVLRFARRFRRLEGAGTLDGFARQEAQRHAA